MSSDTDQKYPDLMEWARQPADKRAERLARVRDEERGSAGYLFLEYLHRELP